MVPQRSVNPLLIHILGKGVSLATRHSYTIGEIGMLLIWFRILRTHQPAQFGKFALIEFPDMPATSLIPVKLAQLRQRAAELKERYDLPFVKWVHALQQANPPDLQALFR